MTVHLTVRDAVALIELDRGSANALDLATCRELVSAVDDAAQDDTVAVLVLSGRGRRFCGGGDVAGMADATDPGELLGKMAATVHGAVATLHQVAKPVIGAVQGAAAGAGLALAAACDLVVAEEGTVFVAGYPGLGLTPDCGLSWALPRVVGAHRAAEMLLLNHPLTSERALQWGLVNEVVPQGSALTRALELAAVLTEGPAGETRSLLASAWDHDLKDHLDHEAVHVAESAQTRTSRDLVAQFTAPTDRVREDVS